MASWHFWVKNSAGEPLTSYNPFHNLHHRQCAPLLLSDLGEVVQSVSLSPASLQVSQLQLQGLQAAGTHRAAEQLQEQRAGHHACQLVQQPLASCGVETGGNGQTLRKGLIPRGVVCWCCSFRFTEQDKHIRSLVFHQPGTCCKTFFCEGLNANVALKINGAYFEVLFFGWHWIHVFEVIVIKILNFSHNGTSKITFASLLTIIAFSLTDVQFCPFSFFLFSKKKKRLKD